MRNRSFIKRVFVLSVVLISIRAAAQNTTPYVTGLSLNYVRTWDATAPITSADTLIARPLQDVKMTTQYLDGLGRPLQTVVKKGSLVTGGTATDMVSPVIYDEHGREQYQYLPFMADTTGGNTSISDGAFKMNPFQQQSTFMTAMFGGQGETYFYNKTNFEASPLNRPDKVMAAGNNWVGSSRGVETKYWVNTVIDSVKKWNVINVSGNWGSYAIASSNNAYAASELYKNVSVDEHAKQIIEFKDKEGKVILKKVQLTALADTGTGSGYNGWLCTYYIYDILGNLRAVIQPEGVKIIADSGFSNCSPLSDATILGEQCFRYEYDQRNRMIRKKVPGAGDVYMIYDLRNRLVMTQDSNMRAASPNKWMVTKYDSLNRPCETGLWESNTSFADHLSSAYNSISYPTTSSGYEELTKTFYNDYSWLGSYSNPLPSTYSSSFDSYFQTASNSTWPYPQANSQSTLIKGLVTGARTKVLGSSTYLYTVSFFDDKGRVIQGYATNISGGTDIMTTQYTWSGQPLVTINKHIKAGTNSDSLIAVTKLTYDEFFRLLKTEKKLSSTKVNGGAMPSAWITMSEQEYDAFGQLKKKKLGSPVLDSLEYEYNIRGWTLGMNRSYVKDTTSLTHWFGFDLGYDKTALTINGTSHSYAAAQYNGNINGMLWRSTGDDYLRKYDFAYDATNRFLSADFNQLNSNNFSKSAGLIFSVSGMSYDANGNILTMNQKGWKLGGSVTIDSLAYGYNSGTNKLNYVTDRTNNATSYLSDFKEITNNTSQDYTYDGNGNLTNDANKNISLIHYNHLNLPDSIRITGKGFITYGYDAGGNKLKKITRDSTSTPVKTITTLYMGGNYVNDTLQFIGTEEGRARIAFDYNETDTLMVYDYMLKDHLGNIRMILTSQTQVDAYPAATMEDGTITTESLYYENLFPEDPPKNYPADTPPGNLKVARVRGNIEFGPTYMEIGPSKLLKVMAGDSINLQVTSWWSDGNPPQGSPNPLGIYQILSTINGSTVIQNTHYNGNSVQYSTELNNSVTNFLNNQSYDSSKPKAYVSWIAFDERFNFVASNSGFEQVGGSDTLTPHIKPDLAISKNGYVFVYVSNETPNIDVFFDNLQVTHIRGPLLQEVHYYPFGLTQKGISSDALAFGGSENRKKFQTQEFAQEEFSDGGGLEMYEFKWRMSDPQTGRFWQIDPLANSYVYNSTYAFSENHVIAHIELEGLEKVSANDEIAQAREKMYKTAVDNKIKASKEWKENNPKFLSWTGAIVKSNGFSFETKAFFGVAKIGVNTATDEYDVVAVRDNKGVIDGKETYSGEDVRRTIDSYGVEIAGFGKSFSETKETRSRDGAVLSETSETSKTTGFKNVTVTESTDKTGKTNEGTVDLISFKFALIFGVEASLKVNANPHTGANTPPPPKYGHAIDNTGYKINVLPEKRN